MFSLQGTDGNMCGERTYGLFNKSKNNVRVWEREVFQGDLWFNRKLSHVQREQQKRLFHAPQ